MAGCLNCEEKGNVSPENVKRWIKDLSNVLLSSTARNRFKNYLIEKRSEEGQSLVEFWEMCDRFLTKADERCTKTGGADGVDQSAKPVLEEAEEIVQFAEYNIPFDAQMKSLEVALNSGDIERILSVIKEAKDSAANMLKDKGFYDAFCQHLLKEQGLLREGD